MTVTKTRTAAVEVVSAGLLRAWLKCAAPGARLPYVIGADLPQRAAEVQLVRRWIDAGLVSPFRARDEVEPGQFIFLIEKRATDPAALADLGGCPTVQAIGRAAQAVEGGAELTRAQRRKIMALLVQRALADDYCPSNAALARMIGINDDEPGRSRIKYLLQGLAKLGKIEVTNRGKNLPRLVKILTPGQAFERETRA